MTPPVATVPEIDALLARHAPVAVGVSGGKDSQAAAIATYAHLDAIGHEGPRLLIHSDLGSVEWEDSLPVCRKLADRLGTELLIVRRVAGGMMERWESRWDSSVSRYRDLKTVTLVLPWSTPGMRFCTSELKTHVIAAELKRKFKGMTYVNVTGVRRQESAARAKGTVAGKDSSGNWNWRPISDWTVEQVFAAIAAADLEPHRMYGVGLSRVSCRFCIMSSSADLSVAAKTAEAHDIFRRMVGLEARSTFGFQGSKWLADVMPNLLDDELKGAVAEAKVKAARRRELEGSLDQAMLFEKGWPVRQLTDGEADRLAEVRTELCGMLGLASPYLDRATIQGRYAELMQENAERAQRTSKTARRAVPEPVEDEAPSLAMA